MFGKLQRREKGFYSAGTSLVRTYRLLVIAIVLFTLVMGLSAAAQDGPKWIGAFLVKGKVGLKWQTVSDVSEYGIYRKSKSGEYEKVATSDQTRYFDTDLTPGEVYTYKLSFVDASGQELFSGEKSVSIPAAVAGDFNPPIWVGIRLDQDKVFLRWDNVGSAIAYNLYRSMTSGSGYDVVGNAQKTSFADKDGLVKGETYYYVITALNDEFEETEYSEEKSFKFGISMEEQKALAAAETKIELEDVKLTLEYEMDKAGSIQMNQPSDIFINSKGDIYLTDVLNCQIHCLDLNGKYKFSFGERTDDADLENPPGGTFRIPFTLFIDKSDQVYVSDVDNHDIQIFSSDGKFIKRITVDCGEGKQKLRANGFHVFDDGRIILTDAGNHRFMMIDKDGKILFEKGGRGDGDGEFNFPDELVVTKENNLFIVDGINCRVQKFDLEGNHKLTFGTVGQSAGTFARPKGISFDENGRIYVSDAMSGLIQGFNQDGEVKVALGVGDDVKFITPRGMFFKDGKLFVINRAINKLAVYKIN